VRTGMSRHTTCATRTAYERSHDPRPCALVPSPTRRTERTGVRVGVRALGVGLVLLVTATPAVAAGAAAERSQPLASADSSAEIAVAEDGQTSAGLGCAENPCVATTPGEVGAPARPRAPARKTPWLGLSASHIVPMEERKLGLRLLRGLYATVSLVPARPLLDPIPTDVHTTDRVRVGLGCMVRF